MKLLTFLMSLLLLSTLSFGQIFVGDIDINSQDSIRIVEVFIGRRGLTNGVNVYVDFGQKTNATVRGIGNRNDESIIMNHRSGKRIVFKSTAAVLNFFERNNWDYTNSLVDNAPDPSGFYYYFKKRKSASNGAF